MRQPCKVSWYCLSMFRIACSPLFPFEAAELMEIKTAWYSISFWEKYIRTECPSGSPIWIMFRHGISPPVSVPWYGMVGTVAGDGAPRSLSDVRSSGVRRPFSFSDSPLDGPRSFLLPMFHPELPFFFGIAVLADASTASAIVSHHSHVAAQLALCAAGWFVFVTVSYPCQSWLNLPQTFTIPTTPVDRSLVMRALGGAITSPCSNDSESRRPTPTISGLSLHLLFRWYAIGLSNAPYGTLWETASWILYYTSRVQLSLQYRHLCIDCNLVSADRRATARTTTFVEPCSH